MAWEYLEHLDQRYKTVADKLPPLRGETVIDLDSGNSRLKQYLQGEFNYLSNDINYKEATFKCTDEEMVKRLDFCHVLCVFGVGGYEISHSPYESSTLTQSIKDIITIFKPEFVVLESIQKYKPILDNIQSFATGYTMFYEEDNTYTVPDIHPGLQYCLQRRIVILKRKQNE